MAKVDKVYVVHCDRDRGTSMEFTGTLAELIDSFGYTLECGASWQHEKGNKKINRKPASIATLVTNLNNAVNNSAANGYAGNSYCLVDTAAK